MVLGLAGGGGREVIRRLWSEMSGSGGNTETAGTLGSDERTGEGKRMRSRV